MTTVKIGGGSTRVTIAGGNAQRITLDRSTVAQINTHRPRTVIAGGSRPVQVESRNTVVRAGSAMGVQGPQGEQGPPGVGADGGVPPIAWSYGDASSDVFTPDRAGILTVARIKIATPFDGEGAAIRVGTAGDPDAVLPGAFIDPHAAIESENTPDIALTAGQAVRLSIEPGTATQGAGLLFLTFIPTE